jgi:integrase
MVGPSPGGASTPHSFVPRHGPVSGVSVSTTCGTHSPRSCSTLVREVAVISKMLGHADYSTVDVYSHLSRERSRVAAARIDGLLKRRHVAEEIA